MIQLQYYSTASMEEPAASIALSERSVLKAFEVLNENPETRHEVIAELRRRIEERELEGELKIDALLTECLWPMV